MEILWYSWSVVLPGKCSSDGKQLYCACSPSFTGRRCEHKVCECKCKASEPDCKCGPECTSKAVVQCRPDQCANGGTCVVLNGTTVCRYVKTL